MSTSAPSLASAHPLPSPQPRSTYIQIDDGQPLQFSQAFQLIKEGGTYWVSVPSFSCAARTETLTEICLGFRAGSTTFSDSSTVKAGVARGRKCRKTESNVCFEEGDLWEGLAFESQDSHSVRRTVPPIHENPLHLLLVLQKGL